SNLGWPEAGRRFQTAGQDAPRRNLVSANRSRALLAGPQRGPRGGHRADARRHLLRRPAGAAPRPRAAAAVAQRGADHERRAAGDAVRRALTLDVDNPASVVACVGRAREGARTVRDVISAEMWEAINTTNLTLLEGDLSARLRKGPYSVYGYVRERSALFWGL